MKIINNMTPPDSVKFSGLEIGEVFFDPEGEIFCMKVNENVYPEATTRIYVNNAIDLSDGSFIHWDPDEIVRRIHAELVISNW